MDGIQHNELDVRETLIMLSEQLKSLEQRLDMRFKHIEDMIQAMQKDARVRDDTMVKDKEALEQRIRQLEERTTRMDVYIKILATIVTFSLLQIVGKILSLILVH